jgi:hypothetical protein
VQLTPETYRAKDKEEWEIHEKYIYLDLDLNIELPKCTEKRMLNSETQSPGTPPKHDDIWNMKLERISARNNTINLSI